MNDGYISKKIKSSVASLWRDYQDSDAFSTKSENKASTTVVGTFRELLVNDLIRPWLPPSLRTGTGTIIDSNNNKYNTVQDDVIIYDPDFTPHLTQLNGSFGLFLYNGVYARIEIKSKLEVRHINSFIDNSKRVSSFHLVTTREPSQPTTICNFLFAFESSVSEATLLTKLKSTLTDNGPVVSGICILKDNFYKWHGDASLSGCLPYIAKIKTTDIETTGLYFLAIISSTMSREFQKRRGMNSPLYVGVGDYLEDNVWSACDK